MKRIFTSALIIFLSISAAQAQTKGKHQGHKKEHRKDVDELNLSADQKSRLKSINEDFRNGMKRLKANTALSAEERKSQKQTLVDQHRSQIASVLTPEQRQKWQSKQRTWKEKPGGTKGKFNKEGKGVARRGSDKKIK